MLLGNVLDIGTPSDGTVTNAKLAQDIISGETELAVTPATTDELLISDAGTLKRVDVSVLGNAPAFQVRLGSGQSVSDATTTKITFDTEIYDTDSAFASNKFTVPTGEDGKYFIYSFLVGNSGTDTNLQRIYTMLYKNGAQVQIANLNLKANFGRVLHANLFTVLDLSASDYLEVYTNVDTNNSGATTLAGDATEHCLFGGYKLIGI
jgi:hypothetical protein